MAQLKEKQMVKCGEMHVAYRVQKINKERTFVYKGR